MEVTVIGVMKKSTLFLSLTLMVLVASSAQAEVLRSIGDDTFVVDGVFQIKKPTGSWDTMEVNKFRFPVKWVKHVTGPNPVMSLRWRPDPAGPTPSDFARQVEGEMKKRGMMVESTEKRNVNGQSVTLIRGILGKERVLIATWRTPTRGYYLECRVETSYYKHYRTQFMKGHRFGSNL